MCPPAPALFTADQHSRHKENTMAAKTLRVVPLLGAALLLLSATTAGSGASGAASPGGVFPWGMFGPEMPISVASGMPVTHRYTPAVAADRTRDQYMVVWHNEWPGGEKDIYARRLSRDGRLLSWFSVSVGPTDRIRPDVAFNSANDEYLVVWMQDVSGNGTQHEIWGRFVAWDGSYQRPEFQIITWPGRSFWSPRVVYNSSRNQYLVVWNAFDTTTQQPTDISSMLLAADGTAITGRNITTSDKPHQVDVVWNWSTNQYFVVFVRSYPQTTTGSDIYGLRVTADNAVVPGSLQAIDSRASEQYAPRAAVDGRGNVMVVWVHRHSSTDHDIMGRQIDQLGNLLGDRLIVSNYPQDEGRPAIAAGLTGSQYLAVWQRWVSGRWVISARSWGDGMPPQLFEIATGASWHKEAPAVVANPPGYLVAYEADDTGDHRARRQIYGRQWTPHGVFLPFLRRR
jgi:hypothetical protein